ATAIVAAGTATAAAVAAAATRTAAATTAFTTLFSLVHAKGAPVEHGPVHLLDGLLGRFRCRHFHEGKAAGTARFAIDDELDVRDVSELGERALQRVLCGVK